MFSSKNNHFQLRERCQLCICASNKQEPPTCAHKNPPQAMVLTLCPESTGSL